MAKKPDAEAEHQKLVEAARAALEVWAQAEAAVVVSAEKLAATDTDDA